MKLKENKTVLIAGLAVGIAAVLLAKLGNPGNMGFCIACFIRDIAGGLGLHSAAKVQYIRPEIIGLVLGACVMAFCKGEFKPRGGSSPVTRFFLGVVIMIGALAFLGCPLRMIIRLGAGDLNALVGLIGFAAGIFIGTRFLNAGFSLKRSYALGMGEGLAFPAALAVLLVLFIAVPALFKQSAEGPGSMHANLFVALAVSLVIGALAQRARLCLAGGLRDTMLFGDTKLLFGFIAVFAAVLIGSLCLGTFKLGFTGQKIAHNDHLWNLLGMVLVGWGAVLAGGCPLRQLILAGEGSGDSAITVLGMLVGAALSHNFGLAGNAGSVADGGGVAAAGRIAIVLCIVILAVISLVNLPKKEQNT